MNNAMPKELNYRFGGNTVDITMGNTHIATVLLPYCERNIEATRTTIIEVYAVLKKYYKTAGLIR